MERMYHIAMTKEDAGEYAILTGDPGRVESIAKQLDGARHVASNREYTTWLGTVDGVRVNVTSVGIGGPSMAIGVEELVKLGVRTFIRIGTCGGIDLSVKAGDLIAANAAVRQEGTGLEYLPLAFPAVADFGVTAALKAVLDKHKQNYHIGTVQSKDSFYGEMEPDRMPVREQLTQQWEIYKRSGVLASEMECAALFLLGAALKVRCGGLLLCVWNEERRKAYGDASECHQTQKMYRLAAETIATLIKNDKTVPTA
ncbi:MAG: nucleoside phosphorylase [Clostridiales bacterium]|nr:nucleoside phosphorylase [Clostridiales bacterium]